MLSIFRADQMKDRMMDLLAFTEKEHLAGNKVGLVAGVEHAGVAAQMMAFADLDAIEVVRSGDDMALENALARMAVLSDEDAKDVRFISRDVGDFLSAAILNINFAWLYEAV